jgi:phenylacetic acid degradation protein
VRDVSDQEIAWKQTGTRDYQELTLRSLRSLKEVAPLHAEEPDRKRIEVSDSQPLFKFKV